MRVFVEWGYVDTYGRFEETTITWFASKPEANAWIENKRKRDGGFFQTRRIGWADYNLYLQMQDLERQLKEAKKKFEETIE